MKALATGALAEDIGPSSDGLLIQASRQGHNEFADALDKGVASADPSERTEQLERSAKFIRVTCLQIDDFEDTQLSAGKEEAMQSTQEWRGGR
jgi:hypothetical protein